MGNLIFSGNFDSIGLIVPKIQKILIDSIIRLFGEKDIPSKKGIEKLLNEYGKELPSPLRLQFISFYASLILQDLRKIKSIPEKEGKKEFVEIKGEKEKILKEKAFVRAWTLKTDNPESGDMLSKEEYDNILRNKHKIPLLIKKSNGIKTIFIKGNIRDPSGLSYNLSGLKYKILEYVMKNKGSGGDLLNMLENVWNQKIQVENLRQKLE